MTEGAFAAIDVEIAAKQAGSICQVGAVVFDDAGRPVEGGRRELLVRPPGNRYSPDFFKYHGVKPEDTEDAPTWAEAAAAIVEIVKGLPLVAHNAEYESEQFAAAEGTPPELLSASFYCSLRLSRYVDDREEKHTLEECARRYGLRRTGAKGALSDALLAGHLWVKLVAKKGWGVVDSFAEMDALPVEVGTWEWLGERLPPTEKQIDFLFSLIEEKGAKVKLGGKRVRKRRDLYRLSRVEASELIDRLKSR